MYSTFYVSNYLRVFVDVASMIERSFWNVSTGRINGTLSNVWNKKPEASVDIVVPKNIKLLICPQTIEDADEHSTYNIVYKEIF